MRPPRRVPPLGPERDRVLWEALGYERKGPCPLEHTTCPGRYEIPGWTLTPCLPPISTDPAACDLFVEILATLRHKRCWMRQNISGVPGWEVYFGPRMRAEHILERSSTAPIAKLPDGLPHDASWTFGETRCDAVTSAALNVLALEIWVS